MDKAPTLTSVLMDLILIMLTRLAPRPRPTLAESDELILVSLFHSLSLSLVSRLHYSNLGQDMSEIDYNPIPSLELWPLYQRQKRTRFELTAIAPTSTAAQLSTP